MSGLWYFWGSLALLLGGDFVNRRILGRAGAFSAAEPQKLTQKGSDSAWRAILEGDHARKN